MRPINTRGGPIAGDFERCSVKLENELKEWLDSDEAINTLTNIRKEAKLLCIGMSGETTIVLIGDKVQIRKGKLLLNFTISQ
jgi:hypothetical protein